MSIECISENQSGRWRFLIQHEDPRRIVSMDIDNIGLVKKKIGKYGIFYLKRAQGRGD